jgi:membrane protein DedA with SNARE-associated domain
MSLQEIIILLIAHKYLFLFPFTVIEGPIVTVIAGFLSSLGYFNVFIAYGIIVIGDVAGDCLYYALGHYGGQRFVERWGRFFRVTRENVEKLENHFRNHSGKTLIIGKFTHAIGGVVLVAAGMAKMSLWKFIWYNFIATLPKSLILLLIGFYFGETYNKINRYLDYTAIGTIGLAIIFIGIYFIVKKVGKKYEEKNIN